MCRKQIYSLVLPVLLLLLHCKTPSYQTVTTKFNVFFYAKKYFEKAIKAQEKNYHFDILSDEIINLSTFENVSKESMVHLEKSEKKLLKIIKERELSDNSYIDDTYLMLAQIHFIKKEYQEALDILNYTALHFPKSELYLEIIYWSIKTKIKMGNMANVQASLEIIFRDKRLKGKLREGIARTYAYFLVHKKEYEKAINVLKLAAGSSRDKEDLALFHYALGQLYRKYKDNEQSLTHYRKVVSLYPENYKMYLFAEMAIIFIENDQHKNTRRSLQKIKSLINNEKNRGFLYLLNYKYGFLALKIEDKKSAQQYFLRTLKDKKTYPKLKQVCYDRIGDIYLQKGDYLNAYKYFDTATFLSKKNKFRIEETELKKNNLTTVKNYLEIIQKSDSTIQLYSMNKKQRKEYFKDIFDKKKRRKEKKLPINQDEWKDIDDGGEFYFYNLENVKNGIISFRQKYGKRSLSDHWDRQEAAFTPIKKEIKRINLDSLAQHSKVSRQKYLKALKEKSYASYNLGILYSKKFDQHQLAFRTLSKVLEIWKNDSKLTEVIYFNLINISIQLKNERLALYYKDLLLKKYPNSTYTSLAIQNGSYENDMSFEENVLHTWLAKSLKFLHEEKFLLAIDVSELSIKKYPLDPLRPRFELIIAIANYHLGKISECKQALEGIKNQYPSTPSSVKAEEFLKKLS